jgi:hypothetical protein
MRLHQNHQHDFPHINSMAGIPDARCTDVSREAKCGIVRCVSKTRNTFDAVFDAARAGDVTRRKRGGNGASQGMSVGLSLDGNCPAEPWTSTVWEERYAVSRDIMDLICLLEDGRKTLIDQCVLLTKSQQKESRRKRRQVKETIGIKSLSRPIR